jgi:hypothetical protein
MQFDDAVMAIGTVLDLRRVASAHVVDHRNLNEEELRKALIKVKPQYLHFDTVKSNLEKAFYKNECIDHRTISLILIDDVLLNEDGYIINAGELEEKVMAIEQKIVNMSNEIDISDLVSHKDSHRQKELELYFYILKVAWEYEDSKSPDEVNLLRKFRDKLNVSETNHKVLEAKIGKFPKLNNDIHSRSEILDVRRYLHTLGLLFPIRDEKGNDLDLIPEELASVMNEILEREIKTPNYSILIRNKLVYKKKYLQTALEKASISFSNSDSLEAIADKVIESIKPSVLIGGITPKDGLSNDDLYKWCSVLDLPVSGTKQDRIGRIISYYDSLRQTAPVLDDERVVCYEMYEELAFRDHSVLRAHNIISKDLEIESKFEEATSYLFQTKLNHTPLKQAGSNNPDGLLSFKDMYVMWDNKSKEHPGIVDLKQHINQFHLYMEKANKPVPIFLVIAPGFTEESERAALNYTADNINRNIVLITAKELKNLAEEWSSTDNKRQDEPFPLGLLAKTGRFNSKLLSGFKDK